MKTNFKALAMMVATTLTMTMTIGATSAVAGTYVTQEGTTAQPVWPKWDSVVLDNTKGTFPNLQNLSEIRKGMTKDQLRYLIGSPQYNDGWRPKEWNYLFHFNTPGAGTNNVSTCQYKVLFDKDTYARSFYWNPVDGACPGAAPAPAPSLSETAEPPVVPAVQRYTLNADTLFAFNRGDLGGIKPNGKQELTSLAEQLKTFDQLTAINVIGHTDRLGSADYNNKLSVKRANTVRQYMVNQGLPADKVSADGMGSTQPVKECADDKNKAALIECLQPNRRVEIELYGVSSNNPQ
jgi:outer membrane protein OmpA-like peptidoglycan-associated protein